MIRMITGKILRDSIISASNNVSAHRQEIDALNVFPVPDGDTGTNMSMTLRAAASEAAVFPDNIGVSAAADRIASALLRGARGNSGVILSLIFRGIAKGVKGLDTAGAADVARALACGKDAAYKAVMKPTEGTILTVVRIAADSAEKAAASDDLFQVCRAAYDGACTALADTPNMLPVLKTAGVVDAGGQGFVYALEGMKSVLFANTVISLPEGEEAQPEAEEQTVPSAAAMAESDIRFTYCTEFLIRRENEEDSDELRKYLGAVGDCVVVVDDDSIIKVHVHSNEPGNIIQRAIGYGQLINIKIENMREQHQNALWGAAKESATPMATTTTGQPPAGVGNAVVEAVAVSKRYGMVAVAAGDGIEEMFREIGVDTIVSGGQTMNPSTEDLLRAVQQTPAEHIFILPNNKNIIMAAEQVAMLTDKGISVLHTKSIPQGITAALNFDETAEPDANHLAMMKAAEKVGSGLVTFAARDSSVNGQKVREGEILGMENGKITVIDTDLVNVAYRVTKHLYKKNQTSLITLYYGNGVEESRAEEVATQLRAKYGDDADVSVINGGQPVYYFMISVE